MSIKCKNHKVLQEIIYKALLNRDFYLCIFSVSTKKIICENIRKIKPDELKYVPDLPKEPFMKTSTSELYKGEFGGFPVAIKKYKNPLNTDPRYVPELSPMLK